MDLCIMLRRRRTYALTLVIVVCLFLKGTIILLQMSRRPNIREYSDFIDGILNETLSGYPSDLDQFLRQKLYPQALLLHPLSSRKDSASSINRSAVLNMLEESRNKMMQELSDDVASKYPLAIDIKQISYRFVVNRPIYLAPVNHYTHKYTYNAKDLCNTSSLYLLIMIKSSVHNYHLRHVIRRTWAKDVPSYFPDARVAFVLGYSHKERFLVESENTIYSDIIQGDFHDAYRNNTLKTTMSHYWITDYCRNARFIFFVDDDMFVNLKLVKQFLNSVTPDMEQDLYSGMPASSVLPAREIQSKWYISKEDYPFMVYPDYISGCALFLSQNVVRRCRSVFPYVEYLPFDDVYIGIVAKKLGINRHINLQLWNAHIRNMTNIHNMIANHGFDDGDFLYETYHWFNSL